MAITITVAKLYGDSRRSVEVIMPRLDFKQKSLLFGQTRDGTKALCIGISDIKGQMKCQRVPEVIEDNKQPSKRNNHKKTGSQLTHSPKGNSFSSVPALAEIKGDFRFILEESLRARLESCSKFGVSSLVDYERCGKVLIWKCSD
jgi:hypothetical protein